MIYAISTTILIVHNKTSKKILQEGVVVFHDHYIILIDVKDSLYTE